jgi:hypothetical protein
MLTRPPKSLDTRGPSHGSHTHAKINLINLAHFFNPKNVVPNHHPGHTKHHDKHHKSPRIYPVEIEKPPIKPHPSPRAEKNNKTEQKI